MDLKIIGWTSYDSEFPSATIANEEIGAYLGVVIDEIVKCGYVFSGNDHQNSDTGVPVFDDGTCLRASMRSWGAIMSFAYPLIDGKPTEYMDFYMSTPGDSVFPEYSDIEISPADSDNFNGLINQQDSDLLSQTLGNNIPLMTMDKTLNRIVEEIRLASEDSDDGEDEE